MAESGAGEESVGLLDAVALQVGLIVGGALFSLVGVGVSVAGAGVVVSFGLAMTIAALGLVPTAMLGSAFPTTCGHYRYPRRFVTGWLAFLGAWGLGISMFTGGLPLYALTAGEYLETLLPVRPTAAGLVVLTAFFGLNLLGIRPAARAQVLMFLGLLGALGSFILFGIPSVESANLTPLVSNNVPGVLAGTGLLYFACLGANFVIDIGGDVRDATVTIPRSFLVSVPLVFLIYVLVGYVAVGSIGVDAMAGETLAEPAERFLSPAFQTFFVVGGALFAVATSLNAAFILVPRYMQALAADGLFPAVLGQTNSRFGTAHWALAVTYVASAVTMLAPLPFADLGTLLAFGGAFLVAVVMVAAIAVLRDPPAAFDPSAFPVPRRVVYAMALLAVPLNLLLIVLVATQAPWLFAAWTGALALGLVFYLVRTNYYRPGETYATEHSE
jgi:APA family basic amino acid/polyamine antiporter